MRYSIEEQQRKNRAARVAAIKRRKRRISMGYEPYSKINANGSISTNTPKGIQNWYTTRQLVERVTERLMMSKDDDGFMSCPINGKWQLQIRGKHLRRLLKAMPGLKQRGRLLIMEKTCTQSK